MVDYNKVYNVIDYTVKCWTRSRMIERLSNYSREERTRLLEGRLSPLEWEEYNNQVSHTQEILDRWNDRLEQGLIDKDKIPMLNKFIEEQIKYLDESLFKYDRRIFEKYTVPDNPIPVVDYDDYKYDTGEYQRETASDDITIQKMESDQIKYQQENLTPTKMERWRMDAYFLSTYGYLNMRLYEGKSATEDYYGDGIYEASELEHYDKEFPKIKKSLDNLMNESPGLKVNTRLYHGGMIDTSLVPGMKGTFKGYTSTSFQEDIAKRYANHSDKLGCDWVIEILAPKGTKGICANDHENFNNNGYVFEHEYTLPRNTSYTVLEMDYVNHRQVVVLDG